MKKYLVFAIYLLIASYIAFAQVVVFVFNPAFSLEQRNVGLEVGMYLIHGFVFFAYIYGVGYLGKKLWKR